MNKCHENKSNHHNHQNYGLDRNHNLYLNLLSIFGDKQFAQLIDNEDKEIINEKW